MVGWWGMPPRFARESAPAALSAQIPTNLREECTHMRTTAGTGIARAGSVRDRRALVPRRGADPSGGFIGDFGADIRRAELIQERGRVIGAELGDVSPEGAAGGCALAEGAEDN